MKIRENGFVLGMAFLMLTTSFIMPARGDNGLEELPGTIVRVRKSVVGIGTVQKTRRPPNLLLATGFAVADGRHVLTNAHAIPEKLDEQHHETLAAFAISEKDPVSFEARIAAKDDEHDLCVLQIDGPGLPPMTLGDDRTVREGQLYAFTGYPLGAMLGLIPATHRGMVAAITPIAIPANHGRQLAKEVVNYLNSPMTVFQLDATAYPGNSGSPLYSMGDGKVVGIVNMVFVKGIKEKAITDPSGISYAIPIHHAKTLLEKLKTSH